MEKTSVSGMKFISILLAGILFLGVFSLVGFSDGGNETSSGPSPESPFYFMKRWGEGIKFAFAKAEKKAELRQEFAAERLKEARELYSKNKTALAEKMVSEAQEAIGESADQAERLAKSNRTYGLENAVFRHAENLERFASLVSSVCANSTGNSSKCSVLMEVQEKMEERDERFESLVNRTVELKEKVRAKIESGNLTDAQKARLRKIVKDRKEDIKDLLEDLRDRKEDVRDRIEDKREGRRENSNFNGTRPGTRPMPPLNGTAGPREGKGKEFRDEVVEDDSRDASSANISGKGLTELYNYSLVKSFVYRLDASGNSTDISYSVSSGTVDGKDAWIHSTETQIQGTISSTKTYLDKATLGCLKITSQVNAMGSVIENSVACPSSGPDAPKASEPILSYGGTESLTVPAGTYSADKYEIESSGIEYFVAAGVPIPVKVEYSGAELKLVSWS